MSTHPKFKILKNPETNTSLTSISLGGLLVLLCAPAFAVERAEVTPVQKVIALMEGQGCHFSLYTPKALNKNIPNSEEGTLIFLFYQDLVEGVIERSGTLNLRNCFKHQKGRSWFGKIPDPRCLISKELCGGHVFTFGGLIFLTNVFLFHALGVFFLRVCFSFSPRSWIFGALVL